MGLFGIFIGVFVVILLGSFLFLFDCFVVWGDGVVGVVVFFMVGVVVVVLYVLVEVNVLFVLVVELVIVIIVISVIVILLLILLVIVWVDKKINKKKWKILLLKN